MAKCDVWFVTMTSELEWGGGGYRTSGSNIIQVSAKRAALISRKRRKLLLTVTHQQTQPGLLSFFMKQPKDLVPPTVPTQTRVIAYTMEVSSSSGPRASNIVSVPAIGSASPPAINILVKLETVIKNVPALPDASEANEITAFSQHVPTNLDTDDEWEYLDPMLNHFLGFNRSVKRSSEELQGGDMGLVAMIRYLKDFVGLYQIDIGLLEGKMQQLLDAIQMWCVPTTA